MQVRIVYLGYLAEAAGTRETCIDLSPEVRDTDAIIRSLEPRLAEKLRRPSVRLVVNGTLINGSAPIAGGDEIAFLPPTSGG